MEAKTPNLKWYLSLKIWYFRIAVFIYIIHFGLACLYLFDKQIFKFYKLEFGIACCFKILIGIWHIRYFFFHILPSHHLNLKIHTLWCRTDICSWKLSAKVSSMLDNPLPVPFLCSVCFILKSIRITCEQLIPFRESLFLRWSSVFWAAW